MIVRTAALLFVALAGAALSAQGALPALAPGARNAPKPGRVLYSMVLYRGQWMRKYDVERHKHVEYMRAHGYVHYFGKWRRKAAVKKLQRLAKREMNRLASSSVRTRDLGRRQLHAMAQKHDMPRLVELADRVHRDYERYWYRYRIAQTRIRHTVTMGIRLQHTELLGIDTVPVSLGVGTPVRIQLPRTRSISIGTTVTVPAGIGR